MAGETRFWISWYQPTEDYRPLRDPPNAAVLGWWCSGYRDDDATLCAVVVADSCDKATKVVQVDWPEAFEFRFIEQQEADWTPPGDRFPIDKKGWMAERFGSKT